MPRLIFHTALPPSISCEPHRNNYHPPEHFVKCCDRCLLHHYACVNTYAHFTKYLRPNSFLITSCRLTGKVFQITFDQPLKPHIKSQGRLPRSTSETSRQSPGKSICGTVISRKAALLQFIINGKIDLLHRFRHLHANIDDRTHPCAASEVLHLATSAVVALLLKLASKFSTRTH